VCSSSVGGDNFTADCSIFSVASQSFAECPPVPTGRGYLGAAVVGSTLYAIGGYAETGWDTVESFDQSTQEWTLHLPALPTPRYGLVAATLGTKVFAIGGVAYHIPASAAVEILDTTTMTWSAGSSLITPRSYPAAAVMDGLIYVVGGADYFGNNLQSVEVYSPIAGWQKGPDLLSPGRSHLAVAAQAGFLVVAGGSAGQDPNTYSVTQVESYHT
jgi:non-specific serine/threonine protein kinase